MRKTVRPIALLLIQTFLWMSLSVSSSFATPQNHLRPAVTTANDGGLHTLQKDLVGQTTTARDGGLQKIQPLGKTVRAHLSLFQDPDSRRLDINHLMKQKAFRGKEPFVIVPLQAGKGTRFASPANLPKVIYPIGDRPLGWYIAREARRLRQDGIPTLTVGVIGAYMNPAGTSDLVMEAIGSVDVDQYVRAYMQGGTGYAVFQAERAVREGRNGYKGNVNLIVVPGDVAVTQEALKKLVEAHAPQGKAAASLTLLTTLLDNPEWKGRIVRVRKDNGEFIPDVKALRAQGFDVENNTLVVGIVEQKDINSYITTHQDRTFRFKLMGQEKEVAVDGQSLDRIREVNLLIYAAKATEHFGILRRLSNNNLAKEYYALDVITELLKKGSEIRAVVVPDSRKLRGANTNAEFMDIIAEFLEEYLPEGEVQEIKDKILSKFPIPREEVLKQGPLEPEIIEKAEAPLQAFNHTLRVTENLLSHPGLQDIAVFRARIGQKVLDAIDRAASPREFDRLLAELDGGDREGPSDWQKGIRLFVDDARNNGIPISQADIRYLAQQTEQTKKAVLRFIEDVLDVRVRKDSSANDGGIQMVEGFSGVRVIFGEGPAISPEGKREASLYGYHYLTEAAHRLGKTHLKLLLGADPRPTRRAVQEAFLQGMLSAAKETGITLDLIPLLEDGIVTTPILESAVRTFDADGAVMFTASHNPLNYNGWKFMTANREPQGAPVQGGSLLSPADMGKVIDEVRKEKKAIEKGRSPVLEAIEVVKDEEVKAALERADLKKRSEEVLEGYFQFARETFGLADDAAFEAMHKRTQELTKPVILDPNGGAATRVNSDLLQRFGFKTKEINDTRGVQKHKIEPVKDETEDPFLGLKKEVEATGSPVGTLFDWDADRAVLVVRTSSGEAVELDGQVVAAFNVAMYLSLLDKTGVLEEKKREGKKLAIVVHDATSYRAYDIAEKYFGAEVKEVEVGEVNVVAKMEALRKEGYFVQIGIEGYNGGTIFGESRSRDGFFTALMAGLVDADPEIFIRWLEKTGKLPEEKRQAILRHEYTLDDIAQTLPHYNTFQDIEDEAGKEMGLGISPKDLKGILEQLLSPMIRMEGGRYLLNGVPNKTYRLVEIWNSEETEIRETRTGDESGGWKVVLVDTDGNRSHLWLRGSKTEIGILRLQVESKDRGEAEALKRLFRGLLFEAKTEAQKKRLRIVDETPAHYITEEGGRIGKDVVLSKIATTASIESGSVVEGEQTEIGDQAVVEKISYVNNGRIERSARLTTGLVDHADIGEGTQILQAVVRTDPDTADGWTFDREGAYQVKKVERTSIGAGARVAGRAVVENATLGARSRVVGGVLLNATLGADNEITQTKVTLVHTEDAVKLLGTESLPLEVSESWLGYGFSTTEQSFIDSALHTNQIASIRFDETSNELRLERVMDLPHLATVLRNVVYSSYAGTLAPKAKSGTLMEEQDGRIIIRGITGKESSQHGYLTVDPAAVLTSWLRYITIPSPDRPSSDPFKRVQDPALTHAMSFSVTGYPAGPAVTPIHFPGMDDWGRNLPGGAKYGLHKPALKAPWIFTYSPGTIIQLMERLYTLYEGLPEQRRASVRKEDLNSLAEEMLQTGLAWARKELFTETQKPRYKQRPERLRQLRRWIRRYETHLESGAWKFENGKPLYWRFEGGEWISDRLDLRRLAETVDGIAPGNYRQASFDELADTKEPAISWAEWENYQPVLTDEDLPAQAVDRALADQFDVATRAEGEGFYVDPTADIGPAVVIEPGAYVGPGSILGGRTVVKRNAKLIGVELDSTVVGARADLWFTKARHAEIGEGSLVRLSLLQGRSPGHRIRLGENVQLTSAKIVHTSTEPTLKAGASEIRGETTIGAGSRGRFVLVKHSEVGRNNWLEPYAQLEQVRLGDVAKLGRSGIGTILKHTNVEGHPDSPWTLFTDHHLAGRVYGMEVPAIVYEDEEGRQHVVANTTNVGGGSHVGKQNSKKSIRAKSAFIGTNSVIHPGADLGFATMVFNEVGPEKVMHFTMKRNRGPLYDYLGEILQKRQGLIIRAILSKAMAAMPEDQRYEVDGLVEAMVVEMIRDILNELAEVAPARHEQVASWIHGVLGTRGPQRLSQAAEVAGQLKAILASDVLLEQARQLEVQRQALTVNPSDGPSHHTEVQLLEGLQIGVENLDGRWKMREGKFTEGIWGYEPAKDDYQWIAHESSPTPERFAADGGIRAGQPVLFDKDQRIIAYPILPEGKKVAVISAHPDDGPWGAFLTLSELARLGNRIQPVGLVSGHRQADLPKYRLKKAKTGEARRQAAIETRQGEDRKAWALLRKQTPDPSLVAGPDFLNQAWYDQRGAVDVRMGNGYVDPQRRRLGQVEDTDVEQLYQKIKDADLVFMHHPRDKNKTHEQAHDVAMAAVRRIVERQNRSVTVYLYEMPWSQDFKTDTALFFSKTAFEKLKGQALRLYRSQRAPMLEKYQEDLAGRALEKGREVGSLLREKIEAGGLAIPPALTVAERFGIVKLKPASDGGGRTLPAAERFSLPVRIRGMELLNRAP